MDHNHFVDQSTLKQTTQIGDHMKRFYLIAAIIGTIVPWIFFGQFIAASGIDLPLFAQNLFANGPASGFSADVLISATVFLIWSFGDAQKQGVRQWWLLIPATFLVGLSLALPLYLYLRES